MPVIADERTSRTNQKQRTHKDLLQAAAELLGQGRKPSLEEIAEAAKVSRATAYRYFPNVDALLLEAPLYLAAPQIAGLFGDTDAGDPIDRVKKVDRAFHDMILDNEAALRLMLAYALQRPINQASDADLPARQNRRAPLIEAALAPVHSQMAPRDFDRLVKALSLIVGPEAMIVCRDVLQLEDAEARQIKAWAIDALIGAALEESAQKK